MLKATRQTSSEVDNVKVSVDTSLAYEIHYSKYHSTGLNSSASEVDIQLTLKAMFAKRRIICLKGIARV